MPRILRDFGSFFFPYLSTASWGIITWLAGTSTMNESMYFLLKNWERQTIRLPFGAIWANFQGLFLLVSGRVLQKCHFCLQQLWRNLLSPYFTGWWLQPIWKICSSNWFHLPQFSGRKFQKYFQPPPSSPFKKPTHKPQKSNPPLHPQPETTKTRGARSARNSSASAKSKGNSASICLNNQVGVSKNRGKNHPNGWFL